MFCACICAASLSVPDGIRPALGFVPHARLPGFSDVVELVSSPSLDGFQYRTSFCYRNELMQTPFRLLLEVGRTFNGLMGAF